MWSAGSGYVTLIKAGITAGVRPTTMILGADSRKKWSDLDVMVMQAYQIMESERCSQCGGPRWLCDSDDPALRTRIKESQCDAKRELEKAEETRKDGDNKGITLYPEFWTADGRDLVEFRALYREQVAREAAEDADEDRD